tara:strand:- start:1056 stop:2294 length:1239 start_codon:yes stop_codon:yes gene_type:complete
MGRFDILFAFPQDSLVLESRSGLTINQHESNSKFLESLDDWWLKERKRSTKSSLLFQGGWFLYLGYELASEIEPSLNLHKDHLLPTAFAVRCTAGIIYDHLKKECIFVSENNCEKTKSFLKNDLKKIASTSGATNIINKDLIEDMPINYINMVSKAKKHIKEGHIYQANLSRNWNIQVAPEVTANMIYEKLCITNPAPFAGIAHWNDSSIISSSPERLIKIKEGKISTRPIAGTRRRSCDIQVDSNLSDELFTHPKESAEHIMLVDLERNDLGRVCLPGSVRVDEMMTLESYAHVHHIVSNIKGRLKKEITPGDSIAAVFPGGTITGCPKIRCMQIINELELSARGAYTGSFGYLNLDGSLDLNILIRTMVKHKNEVIFRAGAGIVAESAPRAELNETRAKAKGLLKVFKNV